MHVAFVGTYGLWSPHLETELELAERHLEQGDRVTWALCDGAFEACETNPGHDEIRCRQCTWRIEMGLGLLSAPVELSRLDDWLTEEDRARADAVPTGLSTYEELRALEVDELDAGWGALSSAIWLARDAVIDPSSDLVARLTRAGVKGMLATRRLLDAHPTIERVYVFNGRLAPMRGVLRAVTARAAAGRTIDCLVHERGQDLQHYALFPNSMPHDIGVNVRRANESWDESDRSLEERRRVAVEWYENRARGKQGSWFSFVDDQQAGNLPAGWDPDARNVVLFTTTEYEFVAIGKEWESPLFPTPHAATMQIARALSARGKVHLTIRLHPNPEGRGSQSVAESLALDLPGVTVIPPESEVSTYELMRAADVVVSSGSTAGVEATFWGKPSVLAGRSLYSGLGACHEPESVEELLDMLEDPALGQADHEGALRYGFFQATRGEPFRYFESRDVFDGHFKGVQVTPSPLQKRILRLRSALAARR